MNKRILILTDSLGLPRLTPELCAFEETWPQLLKNFGSLVHQVSIGGATTSDLLRQCPYHKAFSPDMVILQVGIVDCAPRFLKKSELNKIKKIPFGMGARIIKALNNRNIRKLRNITYIKKEVFRKNIIELKKSFPNANWLIIGILPAFEEYEKVLPGVTANVELYNTILKELANIYINTDDLNLKCMMSDYVHLNSYGHNQIFTKLTEVIINA